MSSDGESYGCWFACSVQRQLFFPLSPRPNLSLLLSKSCKLRIVARILTIKVEYWVEFNMADFVSENPRWRTRRSLRNRFSQPYGELNWND